MDSSVPSFNKYEKHERDEIEDICGLPVSELIADVEGERGASGTNSRLVDQQGRKVAEVAGRPVDRHGVRRAAAAHAY